MSQVNHWSERHPPIDSRQTFDYHTYCLLCETQVDPGERCKCCPECGLYPCECGASQ